MKKITKITSLCALVASMSACGTIPETELNDCDYKAGCEKELVPEFSASKLLSPLKCSGERADYDNNLLAYAQENGFAKDWSDWMIENYDRFCLAFDRGQFYEKYFDSKITMAVHYYDDQPLDYVTPWATEDEHMADLEKLLNLAFPGKEFDLVFQGDKESSNGVIYLNYPGISIAGARNVYVHFETILSHEVGHFLGLHHHYENLDQIGQGMNMPPPGEKCIMDRNTNTYDSSCSAALKLDFGTDNSEQIHELAISILDRYPEGFIQESVREYILNEQFDELEDPLQSPAFEKMVIPVDLQQLYKHNQNYLNPFSL